VSIVEVGPVTSLHDSNALERLQGESDEQIKLIETFVSASNSFVLAKIVFLYTKLGFSGIKNTLNFVAQFLLYLIIYMIIILWACNFVVCRF